MNVWMVVQDVEGDETLYALYATIEAAMVAVEAEVARTDDKITWSVLDENDHKSAYGVVSTVEHEMFDITQVYVQGS